MRPVSRLARFTPLAAAPLLLQPSVALADDTEFWIELSASGDIAERAKLTVEMEERRQRGANDYVFGAVIDRAVGEGFTIGGGVEVNDQGGFSEIRPYQQVGYSTGILSLRTRVEQRFFDDADRMGLRLRQRVQLSDQIAPKLSAAGSVELLYQLRDSERGGPQRVDQWRFDAGLTYRVAERFSITGGYMLQLRPRPGGDTYTHVPQASVAYRF